MAVNWSEVGGAVVGTGAGSLVTGFVAWAAFATRLKVVATRFSDNKTVMQNQHDQCRTEIKADISAVREELKDHASEKNHPPEIFRTLLMNKLTGIDTRLESIEEHLRKGR